MREGAITVEQGRAWAATYRGARALVGRLSGIRRTELRAAVSGFERLVLDRRLTPSRMPAAFLAVQRNAEFWGAGAFPPAPPAPPRSGPCAGGSGQGGARVTFAGDPVIFQWYRGRGLQLQPLATFGRANALWRACQDPAQPCLRDELRLLLDRMAALGARRGGFLAWEYGFAFAGGSPPWISGLAQGTGIQAFTRAAALLGEPRYVDVARRALGAFERRPPVGVRVPAAGGSHYVLYSFQPDLRVLNGFLQALVGLYDYAVATGDPRGRRLFAQGDRAARRELARYDTGAWSRYSADGRESDLGYHRLVRDFLTSLCDRTTAAAYCGYAARFPAYTRERTRVAFPPLRAARVGRPARIAFTLSKVSCTTLRVRDETGAVVHERTVVFARGPHELPWTPAEPGRYVVQIQARDLNNHFTRVERTLAVERAAEWDRRRRG